MSAEARNRSVGRDRDSNAELEDPPPSAHTVRTKQEDFGFLLRRSMPYGGAREHGLYFVAFASSLAPFTRQLERMAGVDDGIVDGITAFSRAVTGSHYFCPPLLDGRLDLAGLRSADSLTPS